MNRHQVLERRIRILLIGFVVGLLVSGITAFPLPLEVRGLADLLGLQPDAGSSTYPGLYGWIVQVREGLNSTEAHFPFLFYGTDWLAFAHIVIAILFVGPIKDPVRNIWVIQWGVIACALVIPLALICGSMRGIPFAWRLIDCSFGVVGVVPLLLCLRWIKSFQT